MAQEPPKFERREQYKSTVGNTPFVSGFDKIAKGSGQLAEFGARISQKAGNMIAERRGYQDGLNPKGGSLLPPLTQADEVYNKSYLSQAQNTLGLRANALLNDAQNEMAAIPRLTPEDVEQYNQKVSTGIAEIISLAPDKIKPTLEAQFTSAFMRSSSNLSQRLMKEQHQEARDKGNIFTKEQLTSIYTDARDGNSKNAQQLFTALNARLDEMKEGGLFSSTEIQTAKKTARINYYSGVFENEALAAYRDKKIDAYLSDFLDKKPSDISIDEWNSIAKNVVTSVAQQENFQKRRENVLYSEGYRHYWEGTLDTNDLMEMQEQTTDQARFNNFKAQISMFDRKYNKDQIGSQALIEKWSLSDSHANATSTQKNNALAMQAESIKRAYESKGESISDFDAAVNAMAMSGGPIPSFTNIIDGGMRSGSPESMQRSFQAYQRLNRENPKALRNLTDATTAAMASYDYLVKNGYTPGDAAVKVSETIYNKDENQRETNISLIKSYAKDNYSKQSDLLSWSEQFRDSTATVTNLPAFAQQAKRMFELNMQFSNGDSEVAIQATKDGIKRVWGDTEINGNSEYVYQPLEKVIDIDSRGLPYVREDLYSQLKSLVSGMNEIATKDPSRLPFIYRLPERPSYSDYIKAKKIASKKPVKSTKEQSLNDLISEFNDALEVKKRYESTDVEIDKVYPNGDVEHYTAYIQASPIMQVSPDGTVGYFDVSLKSKKGLITTMAGDFGRGFVSYPSYKPDSETIRNRFSQQTSINPWGDLTTEEAQKKWRSIQKTRKATEKVTSALSTSGAPYGGILSYMALLWGEDK